MQFDDQLPRAQVQQARAELSIAQANHQRNKELVAQGFVSQRSLDESAANLQVAQAKLALAEATAARLRIVAPFDGIAGIRNVSVGDYLRTAPTSSTSRISTACSSISGSPSATRARCAWARSRWSRSMPCRARPIRPRCVPLTHRSTPMAVR